VYQAVELRKGGDVSVEEREGMSRMQLAKTWVLGVVCTRFSRDKVQHTGKRLLVSYR
jgi:hypothetical protein